MRRREEVNNQLMNCFERLAFATHNIKYMKSIIASHYLLCSLCESTNMVNIKKLHKKEMIMLIRRNKFLMYKGVYREIFKAINNRNQTNKQQTQKAPADVVRWRKNILNCMSISP